MNIGDFKVSNNMNRWIDDIFTFLGKYYYFSVIILHVTYIFIFFGVLSVYPSYLKPLTTAVEFFIGFFLVWRFHPFRKHELKEYDTKVIFGSGIFLLTNVGFITLFKKRIENDINSVVNIHR